MKILADENMPGVQQLFGAFGQVTLRPGRQISPADLQDTDVLLVRSVTPVNQALLENTPVRFVGSATIGMDHVDTAWLQQQGIAYANAPGCNALAVGDYVIASLCAVEAGWLGKTVGIIGCGNVGGSLYRRLKALGVECRCYDPFLDSAANPDLCSLENVLQSRIICLHTPLTRDGPYPTWHMLDSKHLGMLPKGALLLNAGRGAAVDNLALLERIKQGAVRAVLDVWEWEPDIHTELLGDVQIGTPHIAGYSVEGKQNGTAMIFDAFLKWLGRESESQKSSADFRQEAPRTLAVADGANLEDIVLQVYNPLVDTQALRDGIARHPQAVATVFDGLRKNYPQRREFSHYRIQGHVPEALRSQLQALGFSLC